MSQDAQRWTSAFRQLAAEGVRGEWVAEIDSTNTELMRRARAGSTEPVLLVAERQTAGRGRLGRTWASVPGASLTFSLGMPLAPADWSGLSLAVGVSLAESLHPRVGIKWPNDLWVDGRKLVGILVETAGAGAPSAQARHVVVGVGINIDAPAPGSYSMPPAWTRELLPDLDAPAVLDRVAVALLRTVRAFEATGFAAFRARFEARDLLRDRPVVLSDGTQGTSHGTTDAGGLLVHTAAGMVTVTSSEVSVRPAA